MGEGSLRPSPVCLQLTALMGLGLPGSPPKSPGGGWGLPVGGAGPRVGLGAPGSRRAAGSRGVLSSSSRPCPRWSHGLGSWSGLCSGYKGTESGASGEV